MTPELLFDVTPDCFMPQPKVTSAVVKMTKRTEPPVVVNDEKLFFRAVRAAFEQRRKTLSNALSGKLGENLPKEKIILAIERCGLDARVRGETLSIEKFAELSNILGKMSENNALTMKYSGNR